MLKLNERKEFFFEKREKRLWSIGGDFLLLFTHIYACKDIFRLLCIESTFAAKTLKPFPFFAPAHKRTQAHPCTHTHTLSLSRTLAHFLSVHDRMLTRIIFLSYKSHRHTRTQKALSISHTQTIAHHTIFLFSPYLLHTLLSFSLSRCITHTYTQACNTQTSFS